MLFIGYAGGKSVFGLKGEVTAALERLPAATHVRWEVTTAYLTRYKELLMLHEYENGQLPPDSRRVRLCSAEAEIFGKKRDYFFVSGVVVVVAPLAARA